MKYLKGKEIENIDPDRQSFEAVAELKPATDLHDPFLIYKINNKKLGHGDDYIIKTSRRALDICMLMDQNSEGNNILKQETAYFDGQHSRCQGFVTLLLFVFHPEMKKILRLATMEVRKENTSTIAQFWHLLGQAISLQSQKPDQLFNPSTMIVDENGGNFCGIREIYGADFEKQQVVSCQLHFKLDAQRNNKVGTEHREDFIKKLHQMVCAPTVGHYNKIGEEVEEIVSIYPGVKNFFQWWDARRYHVFPAFRGFASQVYHWLKLAIAHFKETKSNSCLMWPLMTCQQ